MRPRLFAAAVAGVMGCAAASCSSSSSHSVPAPSHPLAPGELALRHSLGIPDGAKQVVVFAQTSHLDIDWQKTFDDYYRTYVSNILLQARQVLDSQPRAFYSIAEMAYLQHHVQVHPEELAPLQADAKRGALRIVGGGMTSPDTLLPEPEMLFRDLLEGVRFSEDTFGVTPRAAWLPDSFGQSGTVPDVFAAAGFDSVGFSRIDGSPTIYHELMVTPPGPLPGSTAALLKKLGSCDFVWHGVGGASILAHFIAGKGLYCEGEGIDYSFDLSTPGGHVGNFEGNDPSFTDSRIDGYVTENTPYARTPYLFVPVGCDFEAPKPQLLSYLDGYNQRRYPTTGAWAVAASFEDYEKLVGYWRDVLPEVSGDLAPAFMGFFGTRPAVKRAIRDAARPFFMAETFAAALGDQGTQIIETAAPELSLLTRTDHHDFVTGTSSDPVVTDEQMPLLDEAELEGESVEREVAIALGARIPSTPGASTRVVALNASSATRSETAEVLVPIEGSVALPLHAEVQGQPIPMEVARTRRPRAEFAIVRLAMAGLPPWSWTTVDLVPGSAPSPSSLVSIELLDASGQPATGSAVTRVVLQNASVRAEFDAGTSGFALTSLTVAGASALAGPSLSFNDYADQGGLYRLGNEMSGCAFTPMAQTAGPSSVQVLENTPLVARVAFIAPSGTIEASLGAGQPGLDVAVTTGAAESTTRTVSILVDAPSGAAMTTSSPAGWQVRPAQHVFGPTFFPAVSWIQVGGWAVLLRQSTGVRMSTPGQLELMVARDARSEQCDVLGGTGTDTSTHRIEWRIQPAAQIADAARAAQAFDRPVDLMVVGTAQAVTTDLPPVQSLVTIGEGAIVSAVKPAERGPGVVVRALLTTGPATLKLLGPLAGKEVQRVDLAERSGPSLGAVDAVMLDPAQLGLIAGLRVH